MTLEKIALAVDCEATEEPESGRTAELPDTAAHLADLAERRQAVVSPWPNLRCSREHRRAIGLLQIALHDRLGLGAFQVRILSELLARLTASQEVPALIES